MMDSERHEREKERKRETEGEREAIDGYLGRQI